jgi:hypothetical protein
MKIVTSDLLSAMIDNSETAPGVLSEPAAERTSLIA